MGNTPNIRFKGFSDEWEERKLSDVAECLDNMRVPINAEERAKIPGSIPYYGAGNVQGYIDKYLFDEELVLLLEDGDAFDDYRTKSIAQYVKGKCWVNNHAHVLRPKGSGYFLFSSLEHKDIRSATQLAGASRKKLVKSSMLDIELNIPSVNEQEKVGEFLRVLDNLIILHQRKCDETKELRKFMLQKMFPKKNEKNPEIRFAGFTDDWKQRKLLDIADKAVDNRGKTPTISEEGTHPLLEVASLGNGTPDYTKVNKYLSDETFERELRAYIKEGDILFSTVGSIGLVSLMDSNENAAIAQNIVAFRAKEKFDSKFLYAMFSTEYNQNKAQRIVMGAVQPSIKVSQLVDVEYFVTENKEEQQKLGDYFLNLDHLITHHQQKCNQLKELKKFMLQNMFPQKG